MDQSIRFATWNLNWMGGAESNQRKLKFLKSQSWDVLALQEVTPQMVSAIADSGVAEVWAYPGDLRGDRFASALLARDGFSLEQVSLIAELPDPRWGIAAHAKNGALELDVLSWHAPNAAKAENRQIKRAGYMAFEAWVAARRGPLLVGTDANHGSFYTREEDFPGSPMKLDFPRDAWWEENSWWTRDDPD